MEAEIAELKEGNALSGGHSEEEVLALLNDNTSFKQEIRELERLVADLRGQVEQDEVTIAALQTALSQSNRCTAVLQETILALSQRSSDQHEDASIRVKTNKADYEQLYLVYKAASSRTKQAGYCSYRGGAASLSFGGEGNRIQNVLQDLIASRLKLAQLSSDANKSRKLNKQMQSALREKDDTIATLQATIALKKKKLF